MPIKSIERRRQDRELNDFARRLDEVLKKFPSRKSAADAVGKSTDQLAAYTRGENIPPFDVVVRLARSAGVSIDWLANGKGPSTYHPPTPAAADEPAPFNAPSALEEQYVFVPRRAAVAGFTVSSEQMVDYLAFKAEWIQSLGLAPERVALIEAVGDSMEPAVRPGDLLLLDIGVESVRQNAIYVVDLGGELAVKRLQRLFDGRVAMMSDNPAYRVEQLEPEQVDALRVVGRVVWIGRYL